MADTLVAYHGDVELKAKLMGKIEAHRLADELAKGAYVRTNGKTTYCAVGCLLEDPEGGHMRYESEFGIPAHLAHLEDVIFESLPDEQAWLWPERFMGAINPGADLSTVWPLFAVWMMVDEKWGVANTAEDDEVKAICRRVADGYQRKADGNPLSDEDAEALARAARVAWAAWAARDVGDVRDAWVAGAAGAAWAARDVGDVWVAGVAWAARDVRDAWVAGVAWAAWALASSDKLIGLLEAV